MLMIAGGGTGGHIYPAIAVAREFLSRGDERRVVFVGTRYGLEKEIVPKAGFELEFVNIRGLKGKSILQTLGNLLRLPVSVFGAWRSISRHDPDVILGVGGYASGPVLMVGALRGRPTVIEEQNAFPGITNRILAKIVDAIAVGFPRALEIFSRDGLVTGNPVRSEFFELAGEKRSETMRRLLVFGGSQGSRILNETMSSALSLLGQLAGKLEIVHQTGPHDHERVAEAYRASAFNDSRVTPFIEDMATEMARADFVLCRAGAITIGELAALGRGAILVPFALASDNHQEFNARAVEEIGGGVVITEKELTAARLAETIEAMSEDPERLRRMGNAITALASPDASRKIVDLLEKTAEMN
jgi:UDP-N-acetylglucosamine--N-acetylmuramyl-(pentapeptide) pyrophosphoryl-undecaprenol N-acetylglucosamine transferase